MKLHVDQQRRIVTLVLTRENLDALGLLLDRSNAMPAAAVAIDGDYTLHIIPVEHTDPVDDESLTVPAAWG